MDTLALRGTGRRAALQGMGGCGRCAEGSETRPAPGFMAGDSLAHSARPKWRAAASAPPREAIVPPGAANHLPASAEPAGAGVPVLRRGARGPAVAALQEGLRAAGFDPGPTDGAFGPRTAGAVRAFQQARGLSVDGLAGPQTQGALVAAAPAPSGAPAPPAGGVINTPDGPMVRRQGQLISASVAGPFDRMVAAARAAGVELVINSAYRSYDEQVVLWNRYGRNPVRVARPGTSNHQQGSAIDFKNTNGAWAWLRRNASKFGLHNYPPEPWHYSLSGR